MTPVVSLVIPAYNETGRIGATLTHVCAYLDRQPYAWEVIVVVDGGDPNTGIEARQAAAGRANVRVIDNDVNRGKGFSVRRGFAEAEGERLVFIDADLSLPVEALAPMMARFDQGADVVIASRAIPGARRLGRPPRLRLTMGRVFNAFVRALALPGLTDTQCGLKGFRRDAARRIFAAQTIDGFGFDVEVLYLARTLGYRIDELPVACTYHGGSSVSRVGDAIRMVRDVFLVRWRHRPTGVGERRKGR